MIKLYPIEIEAVDETGDVVFKLQTFDEKSATLEVKRIISPGDVDDFCNELKRALTLLELNSDATHPEASD